MSNIPVIDFQCLPSYKRTGKSGSHGHIVVFEATGVIGKIVEKSSRGIPYEFIMEIVARDRCGNDPSVNFIVPALQIFNTPKVLAFTMPNMKSGDLFSLIERVSKGITAPPPMDVVYNIIRDFVTAVCLMHCNGMMHRDIKDANVLLKDDGQGSLLCDFSLATVLQHECGDPFVPYTKGYRPPEIMRYARHKEMQLDFFASDIYAAGAIAAKFLMTVSKEWFMYDTVPCINDMLESKSISDNTKNMLEWMMQTSPHNRPTAKQVLENMVWMRPEGFSLPAPFSPRLIPPVSDDISFVVQRYGMGKNAATLAADIYSTIKDTPEMMGKKKVLLCVALAIKMCEALDERDTLPESFFSGNVIPNFVEVVIHNPETISALHRCIDNCQNLSSAIGQTPSGKNNVDQ